MMGMGRQATMNVTKLSALLASTSLTASRALLHARPAVPPASSPRPPVGSHPHPHRRFGGRRASRRRRASSHRRAGAGAGDGDGGPPHPSAASPAPGGRLTVERIAEALGDGSYRDVLVVAGAGVSCSAGIPDFRTPGSGLYDNLHEYDLPYAEAIFDVDFYRRNPTPFVTLAKEIWPGVKYRPTLTHCFFRLLDEKGILRRIYTQNIDGLEAVAGVDPDRLVECHGHFRAAACVDCGSAHDADACRTSMLERGVAPACAKCGGRVKPSVVFFGEVLPDRFSDLVRDDVASTDLVVAIGTSLLVAPVASVPDWVGGDAHRLLVNRERAGSFLRGGGGPRDAFLEGDCDESVRRLCSMAGWEEELDELYSDVQSK